MRLCVLLVEIISIINCILKLLRRHIQKQSPLDNLLCLRTIKSSARFCLVTTFHFTGIHTVVVVTKQKCLLNCQHYESIMIRWGNDSVLSRTSEHSHNIYNKMPELYKIILYFIWKWFFTKKNNIFHIHVERFSHHHCKHSFYFIFLFK